MINCRAYKKASSLPVGVYRRRWNRFEASIKVNGKTVHLGSFVTSEEASDAFQAAKLEKLRHAEWSL